MGMNKIFIQMQSYFTVEELSWSTTAVTHKIDNTPPNSIICNLEKLIVFLNPLREAWGSPINVTSGYRCSELNELLHGSPTSAHLYGFAADLVPANGKIDEFKNFVKDYLKDKEFDQYIDEKSEKSSWVHIGLFHPNGKTQRKEFLVYRNGKYNCIK